MTDTQLVQGILRNDDQVWRHIYREFRVPFVATLKKILASPLLLANDWDDIFNDACLLLMEKVKGDAFAVVRNGGLFSFLVSLGKGLARNLIRKKRPLDEQQQKRVEDNVHPSDENFDVTVEERQQTQNEFLDRVFDSMPSDCRMMLMAFYWEHKPMDEISSMLGLRNADTAKTKKNRCMNKFKEIAKRLVSSDEYAEDVLRACAERAALRELLESERIMAKDASIVVAACSVDAEDDPDEDQQTDK